MKVTVEQSAHNAGRWDVVIHKGNVTQALPFDFETEAAATDVADHIRPHMAAYAAWQEAATQATLERYR